MKTVLIVLACMLCPPIVLFVIAGVLTFKHRDDAYDHDKWVAQQDQTWMAAQVNPRAVRPADACTRAMRKADAKARGVAARAAYLRSIGVLKAPSPTTADPALASTARTVDES